MQDSKHTSIKVSSKMIYVAGPYSAATSFLREENIRHAERVCLRLWEAGVPAVCVHTMTRFFYGEFDENIAIAIDNVILERCDGMILVEGWEKSPGTLEEIKLFKGPIFYSNQVDVCIHWARGKLLVKADY